MMGPELKKPIYGRVREEIQTVFLRSREVNSLGFTSTLTGIESHLFYFVI